MLIKQEPGYLKANVSLHLSFIKVSSFNTPLSDYMYLFDLFLGVSYLSVHWTINSTSTEGMIVLIVVVQKSIV